MIIESLTNPKFLLWKKLKLKKYRDEHQLFLVYGNHLVTEATRANMLVSTITSNPKLGADFLISKQMFKELCDLPSPPDIMGVCKYLDESYNFGNQVLILDNIQDPDNVGALLRSALAFGFNDIIVSKQTASIYNEKTIRSSQGAIFHLNIVASDLVSAILKLKDDNYLIMGADNKSSGNIIDVNKFGLILGNEGSGISQDVNNLVDHFVTIKTNVVESLNVSVAGAILMYQWGNLK